MHLTLRPLAYASLLLLACKPIEPGSDTGASTGVDTGGDETLGNSSATGGDPTTPPSATTTVDPSSPTATFPTTTPTTDVTSEPTFPTTPTSVTDDPSDPSLSTSTTVDPSFPDTSSSTFPDPDETTFDPDCPDVPNQPQDSECTDASGCGCASGNCFLVPILGGWCGECLVDSDCGDGGCTVPDPLNSLGSVCNAGQKGDGCMTDAVCHDPAAPECASILSIPGIIEVSTCGQCATNADCPAQAPNCTPAYDIGHFTGVTFCAADGSVPNNSGCNPIDDGVPADAACVSGHCGVANVMGLLKVGICGECDADSDCLPGETCTEPVVDLDASVLIGSVCQQ